MKLNHAQEKAAVFISEGMSQAEAARHVGKTAQTVWRWMQIEEYRDYIDALRINATAEAMETLRQNVNASVEVIVDVAKNGAVADEEQSRRLQFAAAKWVAERVLKPALSEERPSAAKRSREAAVELEKLTQDDQSEFLTRGTEPLEIFPGHPKHPDTTEEDLKRNGLT